MNSWVEVDLEKVRETYRRISAICKEGTPMGVVKANAYGHGAVEFAKALAQCGCRFFGVACVEEGLELRQGGITQPILIFGPTDPADLHLAVENDIRPVIVSREDGYALEAAAAKLNTVAKFHYAVDTGMSRIGFRPTEESADVCKELADLPHVEAEGMFTHFATSDEADLTRAKAQAQRYADFLGMLERRGISLKWRHINNSAGIINFETPYEMGRAGIILYGVYPSNEVSHDKVKVLKSLTWYSRVSLVKTLPAGREIGYGGTYTTTRETRVATIATGYADGYPRCFGNRFYVMLHGKKAPILGRVCMDQFMVDVTDIPEAKAGDTATLMGEGVPVEALAEAAGTIAHEIFCNIGRRVKRTYINK